MLEYQDSYQKKKRLTLPSIILAFPQEKTKQNKNKQTKNKTKQNKTKQNKTKQNKNN